MEILQTVKEAWGWTGIDPTEVVTENEFANFILKDADDKFWRLCPEDVYCRVVADSIEAYNKLITDEGFVYDWFVDAYVEDAKEALGELPEGRKYTLIIPGALDGDYDGSNMKIAAVEDIIRASGALGQKIENLPDGSKIDFTATP